MRLSDVYEKAAAMIERGECSYGCFAINRILGRTDIFDESTEAYRRFKELFGPEREPKSLGWWGLTATSDDERVIALCLMAAITKGRKE